MSESVKSPCISVCAVDERDICMGCFRSVREITDWSEYSEDEKREVVVAANARMKARYNLG